MIDPGKKDGKEILTDEEKIINNFFELELYMGEIYNDKEEFDAGNFDPNDPVFNEQAIHLRSIAKEDFQMLILCLTI